VTAPGTASVFAGFRFPREVFSVTVRWYLRYGLSYRDAGELLAERGVAVDHVTVYRWVQRFTPEFIEAARLLAQHGTGVQEVTGQDAGCLRGQELPPCRRRPPRRGTEPGSGQGRPLPHPVPPAEQLTLNPAIAPARVLPRQLLH